jgi:hypothetical protein
MSLPISSLSASRLDWVRGTRTLGPVTPVDPVARTTGGEQGQALDFGPAALVTLSERARALAARPVLGGDDEAVRARDEDRDADAKSTRNTEQTTEKEAPDRPGATGTAAEPWPTAQASDTWRDEATDKNGQADETDITETRGSDASEGKQARGIEPNELTREAQQEVERLKKRDRDVHEHEHAHEAAGGAYAGSASYTYETGPDGKRYAVGGEVPIDVSSVPGDPEATIRKMRVVQRAARAPAHPSGQDLKIAAQAAALEQRARAEMAQERYGSVQAGVKPTKSQEMAPIQSFSTVG